MRSPPPPLTADDPRHPVARSSLHRPCRRLICRSTESLKDTVGRFLPYWHASIAPRILAGQRVLIAAHGNSLRALVKFLDHMSDQDIVELNIPTGIPLVYELDASLKPLKTLLGGSGGGQTGCRGRRQTGQRASPSVKKQAFLAASAINHPLSSAQVTEKAQLIAFFPLTGPQGIHRIDRVFPNRFARLKTIRAALPPTAREVSCQPLPTVPAAWRNSGRLRSVPTGGAVLWMTS